jgi:hypothetical protein
LTKSASFRYYAGNESVFFLITTRTIGEHCERDPVADDKKGNVSSLKARLGGLKADPAAPTGTPIIPGGIAAPAPFTVLPTEDQPSSVSALPPILATPGVTLPPAISPPIAPPGMAPLINLPGLELPPPPPQPVVVQPAPVYREPDPIVIDPDAGSFKLEDDEANKEFEVGKSLGWLKLAIPSAIVGLIGGFFWGTASFSRNFNKGRSVQIEQFKGPFESISASMDQITKRVLEIKDGDKVVDVKLPADLEPILKDINLLSGDTLKQYYATFLRADTLSLLMQYRYLTDRFYKLLREHNKRVENTKDDLLKASQGTLPKPKYMVVLLDQSDQGGIVSGTVVTMRSEPKITVKEEDEALEEEATPGAPPKPAATPKKVKVTYKTYTLQSGFETIPFERESKVKADGTESVREIINQDLIPDYTTQLLTDYKDRVKNLKTLAKTLQELQGKVKTALDADAARSVSF